MQLTFTKMQGAGNDYIYIDCTKELLENPEQAAVTWSDRHFGIGGDGLVLICPSTSADFRMRMFNADGSEGNMCGNAIRCVGKYVYDRGLTHQTRISIETKSGIKYLEMTPENGKIRWVSVDMGQAILDPTEIPVCLPGDRIVNRPADFGGRSYRITCVSMGNPHCVTFVEEDVRTIPLAEIGPLFEHSPLFPQRVNTEFVRVLGPAEIEMRVWERGSGETLACGTGACASLVAAVLNGFCPRDREVTVHLLGGDLLITWLEDGSVRMRGPAEEVFTGTVIWEG